jgi:nitroreductase
MFNDLSTLQSFFATRRSGKPRDMVAPGPDAEQLKVILSAAMRVPDHGKLAPWRMVVIPSEQRDAFAELLKSSYLVEKPEAGRLELEAMEQFANQAPCLVVFLSTPITGSKIPLWEQQLSAGAACMQVLNATHAQGFVGSWLTGWPAYNEQVKLALGGSIHDRIAGYIFMGSPSRDLDERPRPEFDAVVTYWHGPN